MLGGTGPLCAPVALPLSSSVKRSFCPWAAAVEWEDEETRENHVWVWQAPLLFVRERPRDTQRFRREYGTYSGI
jgi:hypothetical protein